MLERLLTGMDAKYIALAGVLFCFSFTIIMLKYFQNSLPRDLGRNFAFNGKKSAGKPRGAGFIFIAVFLAGSILFVKLNKEIAIYLLLTFAAMMTGFLDDCSRAPWGEYKKGILDLLITIFVTATFVSTNKAPYTIYIGIVKEHVTIPKVLFCILCVILIWVSINVTNCSDGVDGLSGTLTITTLVSISAINYLKKGKENGIGLLGSGVYNRLNYIIILFVICLLGYLWYNATPSKLMMGDAGSRAMGIFIAIMVLKSRSPLIYLVVAMVLILDGGLGLLKVSLKRFLKISILKNIRTPLHDHVRKVRGWSNTQTVFRFVIIQIIFSAALVYIYM